ncbi:hypothetical protein GCM10010214_12870 [Streptomyces abikoensis]|nr:hypothetical protein GCM10010214_12870 [Streptomyces abikoensis]
MRNKFAPVLLAPWICPGRWARGGGSGTATHFGEEALHLVVGFHVAACSADGLGGPAQRAASMGVIEDQLPLPAVGVRGPA